MQQQFFTTNSLGKRIYIYINRNNSKAVRLFAISAHENVHKKENKRINKQSNNKRTQTWSILHDYSFFGLDWLISILILSQCNSHDFQKSNTFQQIQWNNHIIFSLNVYWDRKVIRSPALRQKVHTSFSSWMAKLFSINSCMFSKHFWSSAVEANMIKENYYQW